MKGSLGKVVTEDKEVKDIWQKYAEEIHLHHSSFIKKYWRGAHILCEYRSAPGAILHAGTERAGVRIRSSRRFYRVLVGGVPAGVALELQENSTASCGR